MGNPGPRYENTRHNVGFSAVESIAGNLSLQLNKRLFRPYRIGKAATSHGSLCLVQPLTYMNRSGDILPGLFDKTGLGTENLIVIADTLDLPAGAGRLKRKGSSAGHRGLQSILDAVGTGEFLRFYIGVGRPEHKSDVVSYVLEEPSGDDAERIRACILTTAQAVLDLQHEPIDAVMERFNSGRYET